jgi:3-oxoadipate enol-lactonase/4-carboxymuconolactone decarboxylase
VIPHHRFDGPEDAPVLVMSNSLGTDLRMWAPQLLALTERFRVLRYDQRGHGSTPVAPTPSTIDDLAADVVDLLDHNGIDRASFCGLSLGGMVGMAVAAAAPHRVDRLVLCCTSAQLGPPDRWQERIATVQQHGMAGLVDAVLGRWFTPGFLASAPAAVDDVRAMLLTVAPDGYADCCGVIEHMDLRDRLAGITAPTLVVAGEDDPATPPDHGALIAGSIPGARLVVIPAVAHLANVEQPAAMTAAILAHLAPEAVVLHADDPYNRGLRTRREVLGDAHVDRALANATALTKPFQDLITRYAWGEVWSRPGLDRRTRSCVTLAALVALRRDEELTLHLRAARTNGLSLEEIGEVLLQTAIYCGVPAANHAYAIAAKVFAEEAPA